MWFNLIVIVEVHNEVKVNPVLIKVPVAACSVSPDDGAIAKIQSARKQNTKELFYVQPRRLVAAHGVDGVLHRLVAQRVHRRDEEVEGADELLAALDQRPLRVRVVQELVLQLGRLVRQVGEHLAQRALKRGVRFSTLKALAEPR